MKKIKFLNPIKLILYLKSLYIIYVRKIKYKKIIFNLNNSKKLDELGIYIDKNANMYIGINLNPELLLYSDDYLNIVEKNIINDNLKKYINFFINEGIYDYIKIDYDRVKDDFYYGYIIKFHFKYKFNLKTYLKIILSILYMSSLIFLFIFILFKFFL